MSTDPGGAVLQDVDPNASGQVEAPVGTEEPAVAAMEPSFSFEPALQLFPEIRINTARLDGVLSDFQQRLYALETSFARVAETAAAAAHKAGVEPTRRVDMPKIVAKETS